MSDVKPDIELKSDFAKRRRPISKKRKGMGGKGVAIICGDSDPTIKVRFQAEIGDLFQKKVDRIKSVGPLVRPLWRAAALRLKPLRLPRAHLRVFIKD